MGCRGGCSGLMRAAAAVCYAAPGGSPTGGSRSEACVVRGSVVVLALAGGLLVVEATCSV